MVHTVKKKKNWTSCFLVDQNFPCVQFCIYFLLRIFGGRNIPLSHGVSMSVLLVLLLLSLTAGMLILLLLPLITTVVVMLFDVTVMKPVSVLPGPQNH